MAELLTRGTFLDYLDGELKTRGQGIVLPEPSQAIVEVHNILAGSGFDVAPVVYVNRGKGEVIFGALEIVVRPDYTDGTQMYYRNPDEDPLAQILERGRIRQQRIAVSKLVRHVPTKSRFAVSWEEIRGFVAPQVIETLHLEGQIKSNGIVLRVPTKAEFESSGERYPHFNDANSYEWLYDNPGFMGRPLGGCCGRGSLFSIVDLIVSKSRDSIGFRLQAVSPSQKIP